MPVELSPQTESADDAIIRAEDETDEELETLKQKYEARSRQHDALTSQMRQKTTAPARPVRIASAEGAR